MRQGVRSTKVITPTKPTEPPHPKTKTKELYVRIEPISKLYTDDMGSLPFRSLSGNYFIMLSYHVEYNLILVDPLKSGQDRHRLSAENHIMSRLQKNGHNVDLQIIDNECSTSYKLQI